MNGAASARSGRLTFIDGLRGVAIVAVVAFHAGVPGFAGGFVGVDMFFVISGFVITRQIMSQALSGQFSAMDFYARRIVRILPPLLLVVGVTLAGAALCPLLPAEIKELDQSAAAAAAMVSNVFFNNNIEYFATSSEIAPLLHTWSLGVEEQYYLVVPWFILATLAVAARRKWSPVRSVLAVGIVTVVASYLTALILTAPDHRLAFYSVVARAWQFGAGGALAVAVLGGAALAERARLAASLLGLLLVVGSIVLLDRLTPYPGFAALAPTAGTVLLIAAGIASDRSPLIRMLASAPAVAIGVLSYSWYLWHWPLLALVRSFSIAQADLRLDIAASAAALVLAILTWRLLERPMQGLRQRNLTREIGGRIVAMGLVGSLAVAAFAAAAARGPQLDRTLSTEEMGLPSRAYAACNPDLVSFPGGRLCAVGPPSGPSVLFWGDSHAMSLVPAAEWTARGTDRAAVVVSSSACPPLMGIEIEFFRRPRCAMFNDSVLRWIGADAQSIAGVVLTARWSYYNGQLTPALSELERPRLLWRDGSQADAAFAGMLRSGVEATLNSLGTQRRVLIVGPVPELRQAAPNCVFRARLYGQDMRGCGIGRAEVDRRGREALQVLKDVAAKHPNTMVIDPTDVFCDQETCLPYGQNGLYYGDHNHLSPLGTEMLLDHFEREFHWVFGGADQPSAANGSARLDDPLRDAHIGEVTTPTR